MLFDRPDLSDLSVDFWRVLVPAVASLGACVGLLVFAIGRVAPARADRGRGRAGRHVRRGRHRSIPSGTVFVRGEYWRADAEQPVEANERVETLAVEGLAPARAARPPTRLASAHSRTTRKRGGRPWPHTADRGRHPAGVLPGRRARAPGVRARRRVPPRPLRRREARRLPLDRADGRPPGEDQPARDRDGRAGAGGDHPRQRLAEGERGALLPRAPPGEGRDPGGELPVRHLAALADDAAQRVRPGGARRAARRARRRSTAGSRRSSTRRPSRGA